MAMKRKGAKKRAAKGPVKKAAKKAPKKAAKKVAKKVAAKRPMKRAQRTSSAKPAKPTTATTVALSMNGWVTHTELASADPDATRAWCEQALGWSFGQSMPMPDGQYHMFTFGPGIGGGIRRNNPPEVPGTVPYVQVTDADASFKRALAAGAESMMEPTPIMPGVTIAVVRAPGGVVVGLAGP